MKKILPFLAGMMVSAFGILIIICGFKGGRIISSSKYDYYRNLDKSFGKYYSMEESIQKDALYSVNEKKRDKYLAQAMVRSLDDPYSTYYTKDEYEKLERMYSDSYSGIGIALKSQGGKLIVSHVIKDSPAQKSGLRKGDEIISVDDQKPKSVQNASDLISGETGTDVTLELNRGGQTITVTLTREEVEEDSVDYKFLHSDSGKKIGYIRIRHFREGTSDEFQKAIEAMEDGKPKGVIVDVRNNPGGIKDEGVKCADALLSAGNILIEKNKSGEKKVSKADGKSADFKYVILVNGKTASAAEIFAGAIQVNDGGKLIGKKTYGKGVIQSVIQMDDGSAFKFTTEEYFLPDGTAINGNGIQPDIRATSQNALKKGMEELSK